MRLTSPALLACCLAAASVAFVGCKSDEEKVLDKQDKMMSPAMGNAEEMMREGQQMKDKGMQLRNNGMASEGEKMIMDGDKLIEKAKKLKETTLKQ